MFSRVGIIACFYCLLPMHVLGMDKERKEECLPPVTMNSFYNVLMPLRLSQFQSVEVGALVLLLSTILSNQANPNEPIRVKTTLLHVIVEMGDAYIQLAETLLKHGAKFDIPNDAGQTAFDCAMHSKNSRQIFKLLQQQLRLSLMPAECKMSASSSAHSSASATSFQDASATKSMLDRSSLDLRRRFSTLSHPLPVLAVPNTLGSGHHRRDPSESTLKIPIDQSEVTMEMHTQPNINEDDGEIGEQAVTSSLRNMPINLAAAHEVQAQGLGETHTSPHSINAAYERAQTPASAHDNEISTSRSIEASRCEAINPPNSAASSARDASPRQVHSAPTSHRKDGSKDQNDSPRTVLGFMQRNSNSRIAQTVELISRRSPAQEPFTTSMVYERITNAEQDSNAQNSQRSQPEALPNEAESANAVTVAHDLAHAPSPQVSSTNLSTLAQVATNHNATAAPYLHMAAVMPPKQIRMNDIPVAEHEHKSSSPAFSSLSSTIRMPVPWYKRLFCCGGHAS